MSESTINIATPEELAAAYRRSGEREEERRRDGAAIVGYKVGFTNTQAWAQLGVSEPMWGAMYDQSVVNVGEGPFHFVMAGLNGPRIEPEIVLHFFKAPHADATIEQVLSCVDWLAQGYEVVLTPADGKPATALEAIAQGGMHGALLVGQPRKVADLGSDVVARLSEISLELYCDGELKETGKGATVLSNPLNSVLHLIKGLAQHGRAPLKAGDTVTTGTLTAAYPISEGQRWTTRLAGLELPNLDVTFE
jgi:2-keto-4-pentenoate hydratase